MKIYQSRIGILAAGFVAATLALGAAWAEDSPSALLEKGIYQEETAGNLDAAIQIYKKIVDEAQANRTFAAQALYRLGQCQIKQGRGDLANQTFDRLIREFPEQTEWVDQAKKAKTGDGITLLPAPWKDGEKMTLDLVSPAGISVGTAVWAVHSTTFDGKPAWMVTSTISIPVAGYNQTTSVTADRDTFAPFMGETDNHTGDFKAVYRPKEVVLTVNMKGKETTRQIQREGIAFDNEQALYVIRRLPLAPGYEASFPIFPVQSGIVVQCRINVTGTENVETPVGAFLCYKLKLAVYAGGQKALEHHLWITADDNRYLAKYDSGTVVMNLKKVEVDKAQGKPMHYTDPTYGYELVLPAGWSIGAIPSSTSKQIWSLIPPAGVDAQSYFTLFDKDAGWDSVRTMADARNAKRAQFLAGYEVDPASWINTPVSGKNGLAWTAHYTDKGTPKGEYNVAVIRGNLAYLFTFRTAPESMNSMKRTFDSIVEKFSFGKKTEKK